MCNLYFIFQLCFLGKMRVIWKELIKVKKKYSCGLSINHWLTVIPMNLFTTVKQLFWRHTGPFINRLHTFSTPQKQFASVSPFSRNVLARNNSVKSNLWTRLVAPPPPAPALAPRVGHLPSWHTTVKLSTGHQVMGGDHEPRESSSRKLILSISVR